MLPDLGFSPPATGRSGSASLQARALIASNGTMLVEAAAATARMKGVNHLSAQHARLTARLVEATEDGIAQL